jgi:hypothetical protein
MTPEIIAAIIGAVATVVAAIIALRRTEKKEEGDSHGVRENKSQELPKPQPTTPKPKGLNRENFTIANEWESIEKIGNWQITNAANQVPTIVGSGMYSYLLSKNEYGRRLFRIHSKIRFYDYAIHANRGGETGASSFVLGWVNTASGHRYFNLVFTGKRAIFEAIGFNDKPDYLDSWHLYAGIPFSVVEGKTYDFVITISKETIQVFLDGHSFYIISLSKPIYGKVGLRPWRARIECDYYEVSEM